MTPPDDHRTRPDFTPTVPFDSSPGDPPAAAPASAGGYQAAASAPALEAGQLLAGRFRIVRFIAQGGMGEVWEAEDLELPGERVALKTIRPSIARDAWAMGRFRREIQLGRKITHPNVCRIFDVFHHRPGSAGAGGAADPQGPVPAGDLTFLTMELLAGETLERRLERDGRLDTGVALPIVRHLAAALQAAHEAEISHGDFKSSNVMLIGGGDNLRAVVTDFGLSRGGGAAAGLMTSVPAGDHLVGTPAYMAPEQVRGERSSAAADIYALGIVIFEILTGRLPFQAETAISSAVMRLSSPPPPPRTLVPDLDPRWDAVVLRCLALDPADRFARAADVARALEADASPALRLPRAEARGDRRFRSRQAWLAAAIAILLAAGVAGLRWRQRSAAPEASDSAAAAPTAARPAIAVLGFKNASGRPEAAWLSTALAEMLATELAAGNQMRVIPSENVARMRVELGLADFSTLAGDTLDRVRGILGSDLVVLGSYTVLGPEPDAPIRLDLSLQDALAGQTTTLPARNATAGELFELVRLSGADLRRALGTAEPAAREGEGALAAFSTEPEAARLYAEGLALLRRFEGEAARAVLERAVEVDPRQPLAHSALAAAWAAAGYDERATAQAKRAFELSRALPLEQRLEVEGRYREIAGEWPQAIEIYKTLYGNYPDHLDYGLRLVEAQVGAGAGAAARATLAELRRLPGPAGGDPRLDLASAQIAESLSEFAEERDAARRAAELGRASGARLLVARARLAESWAQRNLDQPAAAKAAAQEARTIYAAAGDRAGAAQAVNQLGIIAWQGGDLDAAAGLYEEARAAFSALGDRRGVARALNNTAILLWERQDWPAARAIYERVVDIHRETGSRRHLASTLNNLGIVLREEGRLDDSVRTHREALQIQRSTGELQGQAQSLNNLAQALELQGDVAGARTMTVDALKIFREIGSKASAADALINIAIFDRDRDLARAAAGYTEAVALKREASDQRGLATALTGLGAVLRLRGEFAAARGHQEEALAIRRELGDLARPFVSEIELARLALDEGATDAASRGERAARAAAAAAESAGDAEATAEALLVLARALLEQGRLADSAQALREGASDAAADPAARLGYLIANAQLDAAGGTAATRRTSQSALQRVATEAESLRLPEMAFEARLALAELALAGDAVGGSAALARVRDEATAQGFGAVAARAARRLSRVP